MPSLVVLLGPPGAGKGTQAKHLSGQLSVPHVSSGDLFRENLANRTDLGRVAQTYLSRGELVPDDVTVAMIRQRLQQPDCAKGALLDGFPRTLPQADALDAMAAETGESVDLVAYIRVGEEVLIRRLAGRWSCRAQGHLYHEDYNPPKRRGVCDVDGSELYQRDDDQPETVAKRVRVYMAQTAPLIEHYRQQGKLVEVDGELPIEVIAEGLWAAVRSRLHA